MHTESKTLFIRLPFVLLQIVIQWEWNSLEQLADEFLVEISKTMQNFNENVHFGQHNKLS